MYIKALEFYCIMFCTFTYIFSHLNSPRKMSVYCPTAAGKAFGRLIRGFVILCPYRSQCVRLAVAGQQRLDPVEKSEVHQISQIDGRHLL